MIPKIIHYCWFGGNPLPEDAKRYIETWKKYCPDYEIMEWNEQNFDLTCCDYVKEAYASKKWAFVSDVARLYALVNYGGVYMDTDVEVLRPLDDMLQYEAFSGFESNARIPTGLMACEKGQPLFEKLLRDYDDRHFLKEDGSMDLTTNVDYITRACIPYGVRLDNTEQTVAGLKLFPSDYFCPKDYLTGEIRCTENTYTIHHFSGTWKTPKQQKWMEAERKLRRRFGDGVTESLPLRICRRLYLSGVSGAVKSLKNKLKGA